MKRKVLIIDDIELNREILKNILGSEYDFFEAENGKQALDILSKNYQILSAILLDINMPVMNGYDFLLEFKKVECYKNIPIVVVTEKGSEESEVEALKTGAQDYVSKPFNSTIVKQRIVNVINMSETSAKVNSLQRDKLTGLYAREAFFAKVENLLLNAEKGYYTMSSVNIDSFKVVNDRYGTDIGDQVLIHVAKSINEFVTISEGIACRMMSDNFALLFPTKFLDSVINNENREKTASPTCIDRKISVRVGRYIVEDTSLSSSAIYDRACFAERSIKGAYGVNVAYYNENMRLQIIYEQEIVNEMNEALERNEFEVWYQPQYNHITGALIGAEALVRWNNPRKGYIMPNVFIPIFEKNGFIYALDKFVWSTVCKQLQKWIKEGANPVPISVNVSRYDVFRPDIVETIISIVNEYSVPTNLICFEITESLFSSSTELIVGVVKKLIDYGFVVEIDDFGSGYSSLNTLKNVPAQVVKLDMRFLEDDGESHRGGSIIESVVRMAKWLGMSVIAEGVENKSQADFLKSIGCNNIQGYFYSKPIKLIEFEKILKTSKKQTSKESVVLVENLDNKAFWDPASIDTLIFNSYVGNACIIEVHNGQVEVLRATNKFIQMYENIGVDFNKVLMLDFVKYLDEDSKKRFFEDVDKSEKTRNEVVSEYIFIDIPNVKRKKIYLRTTLRVIAVTETRQLVYALNENITKQREAEQQMRESEKERLAIVERNQAILKSIPAGVTATIYNKDSTSLLFANDRYFELLGYSRADCEQIGTDIINFTHPSDIEIVRKTLIEAYNNNTSESIEFKIINKNGKTCWFRAILSNTNFIDVEQKVQLCIFTDITLEKLAEKEIRDTDNQLRFLNETAHEIISQPNVEESIKVAICRLRDYFDSDRVSVFEIDENETCIKTAYDNVREGFDMHSFSIKEINSTIAKSWIELLRKNKYIEIGDVNSLDNKGYGIELLKKQDIRSFIAVPLFNEASLVGAICLDNPNKNIEHIDRLLIIGNYVSMILKRRDLDEKLNENTKRIAQFMDDIPGGYMRLKVVDNKFVPVYHNDGYKRLTHIDENKITKLYSQDYRECVHPDDVAIFEEATKLMLEKGGARGAHSKKYRIKTENGDYKWVMIFGRSNIIKNSTYLNIYFTEASEEDLLNTFQKQVLDNLPNGTALFEYDGKRLKVIHLNKRYWELVDREPTTLDDVDLLKNIHKDDATIAMEEIKESIREKRFFLCNIRILYRQNSYRLFRVMGRCVENQKGVYSIYTSFLPYTSDELMNKEKSNLLFNAVMLNSDIMVYAKDNDGKFICASKSFAEMYGYHEEKEIVGKTIFELVDKESAEIQDREDQDFIKRGKTVFEKIDFIPTSNDEYKYVSSTKFVLKDELGRTCGIYGSIKDVTKEINDKNRIALLVESIDAGLATFQIENSKPKLCYFNETFYRQSGYSRDEFEAKMNKDPMFIVYDEDKPIIRKVLADIEKKRNSVSMCEFRCHKLDGGYSWFQMRGTVSFVFTNYYIIDIVMLDITQRKSTDSLLNLADEESRKIIQLGGNVICKYDAINKTITMNKEVAEGFELDPVISNVPKNQISTGLVSNETKDNYSKLFSDISNGEKDGCASFEFKNKKGWIWVDARFSTLFDEHYKPIGAMILLLDVTAQRNKEAVYAKWHQTFSTKPIDSYTIFRCNLSKNVAFDSVEGTLLQISFGSGTTASFNKVTEQYANNFVHKEDRYQYSLTMRLDGLKSDFYNGKRISVFEYRELLSNTEYRWIRRTIETVEFPNSNDVIAYLTYENIDNEKRSEIEIITRSQMDSLTGIYNRKTIIEKIEESIQNNVEGDMGALLMLDIDNFKLVNDSFGHPVGDQALIETAKIISTTLKPGDFLGRLGGDEFILYLNKVKNKADIAKRAREICSITQKSYSVEVATSSSIGIAIYPLDANSFDSLYTKADLALYHIKKAGKNNFAFYNSKMDKERIEVSSEVALAISSDSKELKRRMLIAEDNSINREILINIFKEDFIIDIAVDGEDAFERMKQYGIGISIVLLDIFMPIMNGFEVLEKIKGFKELQTIPIIVVSGMNEREASLKAIKCGAADFVTKPIDADVLRLRVQSAISKSENNSLRNKNRQLILQNEEFERYRAVKECENTIYVEYDTQTLNFIFDDSISVYLDGKYDRRPLCSIFEDDKVASQKTIKQLQKLVETVAKSAPSTVKSITAPFKTPSGKMHNFEIRAIKPPKDYRKINNIILSFTDVNI